MGYALAMLWYDRSRFLAAVFAVAFSVILVCMQFGLLLGMFALTSIPIDRAKADVWLGGPDVVSIDVGKPIPDSYMTRLMTQPEIEVVERYILGFQYWRRPDGGTELCIIVGTRLGRNSLGALDHLTPDLRARLTCPRNVVVDRSELDRLGIEGVGAEVEIQDKRVRVVGLVDGTPGLQGPYVFCSLETAKELLEMQPDQATYIVGKCRDSADVQRLVARLKAKYPKMSVLAKSEFSHRSRMHWLTQTKGGIAIGFAAILGLIVGGAITRQSLYSATMASLREYAVLRALGIPRRRLMVNIVWLAIWIGVAGVVVALPALLLIHQIGYHLNVPLVLPWWLPALASAGTWTVAVLAALTTFRSVQRAEPVALLR